MDGFFGINTLANPEALLLLLLIPAYLFWYQRFYRKQRLVLRMSFDPAKLQGNSGFQMAWMRVLPRFLQLGALVMLILALGRPQTSSEVIEREAEGIDIMLVLDVSGSMEAQDYLPNRLAAAKETAINFIESRSEDRIGLVLFASEALSYAPLTLDHDFLIRMVRQISFSQLPKQGTAIGSAVAVGINRMRVAANPSQVMVLLTDGANNRGEIDPITAAKLAATYNIRLYSIGIGRPTPSGTDVAELDETTLRRMASLTGGDYFRVDNSLRLKTVFEEISDLETTTAKIQSFRQIKDHYPLFIQLAILMLSMAFLLMLTFVYNPLEH